MGKFIGGPVDGRASFDAIVQHGMRFNVIPLGDMDGFPRAVYERVRGTKNFRWIATFENDDEYAAWLSVNTNESNFF